MIAVRAELSYLQPCRQGYPDKLGIETVPWNLIRFVPAEGARRNAVDTSRRGGLTRYPSPGSAFFSGRDSTTEERCRIP